MNETLICPACDQPLPEGTKRILTIGRWHPACCPHWAVSLVEVGKPSIWHCYQCASRVEPKDEKDDEGETVFEVIGDIGWEENPVEDREETSIDWKSFLKEGNREEQTSIDWKSFLKEVNREEETSSKERWEDILKGKGVWREADE